MLVKSDESVIELEEYLHSTYTYVRLDVNAKIIAYHVYKEDSRDPFCRIEVHDIDVNNHILYGTYNGTVFKGISELKHYMLRKQDY